MLPFINTFLLYILLEPGQLLNKQYTWFIEKMAPGIPISSKVLGGCILCTSFWMGVAEVLILGENWTMIFYNAVATTILYNLCDR